MDFVRAVGCRILSGLLLTAWVSLPALGWGASLSPLPAPKAQKPAQADLGRYLFFDPQVVGGRRYQLFHVSSTRQGVG